VDENGTPIDDVVYPCCKSLRELHLPSGVRSRDEEECIFFLIRRLLNIHVISYFESLFDVFVILMTEAEQKGQTFTTDIRELQDWSTDANRLKIFSKACPEIFQHHLLIPEPSGIQGLKYFF